MKPVTVKQLASRILRLGIVVSISLSGLLCAANSSASRSDHHEFEASVHVPFRSAANARPGDESRSFTLDFSYPHNQQAHTVAWRLELLAPNGQLVSLWSGLEALSNKPISKKIAWMGRGNATMAALPEGIYQVRLLATAVDNNSQQGRALARSNNQPEKLVSHIFLHHQEELIQQSWPLQIGTPSKISMPAFKALPSTVKARPLSGPSSTQSAALAPAVPAATLPYTIYLGNLHSQSNHSDGGGNLSSCTGAQAPQSAAYGPTDAYQYALNRGLDFLMTSEHNHMYDGSDSTNTSANPATAKNLYQAGLSAASSFNTAHANFLGIYGMEWGVINNGGHLNIFNANELLGWEYNSSSQLLADTFTTKGDYAALYTLMRQRGWVGQFNHPSSSGQFQINGVPLAYSADGDQAMVACEVLNTSAFSTNTSESETGRSTYEAACNKALEAGFHIAFTSNQDNHCANWGASFTNRTGVLLPNGAALNSANFIAALKARRMYATMDKTSQLILTANGHVMGERFSNTGSLLLEANFASSSGRSVASVVIYEGVPGRNGTVTQLSNTATTTITPSVGEHFYYAKITQDDGKLLWSAPIWVSQTSGTGDTTPPTVSASESGSSGMITLSANASDNVGVTKVDFLVDGAVVGSVTSAPFTLSVNSANLSNGSHSLIAKASDAAGNVGTSSAVSFNVNNTTPDTTAPSVSASTSGTSGTITLNATATDNVGVSKVEFHVDGSLKGSDTSSPYSLALNSTSLANGSHSLVAKAFDAANNIGTSSAVSFNVNNPTSTQLISNGGFESASANWTATSGVISNDSSYAARSGSYKAWLNGYGSTHTDTLYQQVSLASTASSATLSFWLRVASDETTSTQAYDTLQVQIRNSSGTVLSTLASYSNLNKGSTYVNKSFDVSAYKGQTIRIYFLGKEGSVTATSFLIDDVSLVVQ